MKTLLLLSLLATAAVITPPVATDFNPHRGVEIDTPWNHKGKQADGVYRFEMPDKVKKELEAMRGVSICKGDMSRCETPVVEAICTDASGSTPALPKCNTWRIFELWRWTKESVQSAPDRVVMSLSPTLEQERFFIKEGGFYITKSWYDKVLGVFHIAPHPSMINYVCMGDVLCVSGGGLVKLGGNFFINTHSTTPGNIMVGALHIAEKDGVKYLKISGPDGKKYGIKLELLDWK